MKKISGIILLLCLFFPACSENDKAKITKHITANGTDISNRVEIIFYMLGDAPGDLKLIEDEINKMALEDLNCTVSFNYTTWSDYMQRYNLLLSSGQPIDLIFTSDWLNYNQYAKKGAFMELNGLLPVYAPELYKFVSRDFWDAVKVNDFIYTIPATWIEYANEGFLYREDLRKKYNLPYPESLENIELFLEGLIKNVPNCVPTSEIVSDVGFGPFFSAQTALEIKYRWVSLSMPYGLKADYDNPTELDVYWGTPEFISDMKMFRRWAEKGFWSRNAISNKNSMGDAFLNEYSVALFSSNPVKYTKAISLMKSRSPEIEVGFYPYGRSTRLVKPIHPIHNGYAVPINAGNPERALMFYEKMVLDKRYNHLTNYGIEGVHYQIDDDGYYEMIGTADTNGFTIESMNSWAWRNPDYMLYERSMDTALELFKEFDTYASPDIFYGFVEDYTPYQAERAALYQVQSQYLVLIQAGMVKDVEKAVADFMEKAYSAGMGKIHKEYKKQWLEYCREIGLE